MFGSLRPGAALAGPPSVALLFSLVRAHCSSHVVKDLKEMKVH